MPRGNWQLVPSPTLDPAVVCQAASEAADIVTGMGYNGKLGSVHLLRLNLQTNTLTAIVHNMVAWRISQLDPKWIFHPKGGGTPDLTCEGEGVQVKVSSDGQVKGNRISSNEGYFLALKYSKIDYSVRIDWIHMGHLLRDDWERPEGTQFAILKPAAKAKLAKVWP